MCISLLRDGIDKVYYHRNNPGDITVKPNSTLRANMPTAAPYFDSDLKTLVSKNCKIIEWDSRLFYRNMSFIPCKQSEEIIYNHIINILSIEYCNLVKASLGHGFE